MKETLRSHSVLDISDTELEYFYATGSKLIIILPSLTETSYRYYKPMRRSRGKPLCCVVMGYEHTLRWIDPSLCLKLSILIFLVITPCGFVGSLDDKVLKENAASIFRSWTQKIYATFRYNCARSYNPTQEIDDFLVAITPILVSEGLIVSLIIISVNMGSYNLL